MSVPRRRKAIVLSGGASYGSYEVGILKALAAGKSPATGFRSFEPSILAGTSVGAFNSAVLTSRHTKALVDAAEELERIWLDQISTASDRCGHGVIRFRTLPLDTFRPACWASSEPAHSLRVFAGDTGRLMTDTLKRGANFLRSDASLMAKSLDLFDLQSFISAEPFQHLIASQIHPSDLRASWRQLRISATNWVTGEVRVFGNDEMSDERTLHTILASAAVPGIFPPVDIDGVPYVDGGVVMYTPLLPAIDAGADEIHVVSTNAAASRMRLPDLPNSVNTFYRTLAISLAAAINRDIQIAERLNTGMAILEAAEKGQVPPQLPLKQILLGLGSIANRKKKAPYRKLTIHRYELVDPSGSLFGWFDFDLDRIRSLIESGYQDAVNHDCITSGCVGV